MSGYDVWGPKDLEDTVVTVLAQMQNVSSQFLLSELQNGTTDGVALVLAMRRDPGAVELLIKTAANADNKLRSEAIRALGSIRDPVALPVLVTALKDKNVDNAAATAIARFGEAGIDSIEKIAQDRDPRARLAVIEVITQAKSRRKLKFLLHTLREDGLRPVRPAFSIGLRMAGGSEETIFDLAMPLIECELPQADDSTREAVVSWLVAMARQLSSPGFISRSERASLFDILRAYGKKELVPLLIEFSHRYEWIEDVLSEMRSTLTSIASELPAEQLRQLASVPDLTGRGSAITDAEGAIYGYTSHMYDFSPVREAASQELRRRNLPS
jgi:hypothetical protein